MTDAANVEVDLLVGSKGVLEISGWVVSEPEAFVLRFESQASVYIGARRLR
jgi:hypothetical protein